MESTVRILEHAVLQLWLVQGPRIHLSGPATWKWALLGTPLKKKKKKKGRAWQKEINKRWKWEMTENAQVDKENNYWALLHGHFLIVVRLSLPFNWSITTASLPWFTGEFEDRSYRCVFLSCKRGEGRRWRLLRYCMEWKTKHTRTSTSSRHRIDTEPSICLSVTNPAAAEDHQGRRTHAPSVPLWFFVTKNQAVAKCQSILEWVPCLPIPWRQKAAWHRGLFFFHTSSSIDIDSFHITWWPWKPVQLDGHLDWLHFDTCGFLNNYTCTCIWNIHDFFKFRVSKCNQSKWPSNCIGFYGHRVIWNSSILYWRGCVFPNFHDNEKKWRKRGVKRTGVNAEEGPALTPLRLHFLRFLSFDDLDDHSLSHLWRANFDVESFSY